jgi:uncharacterized membrane protein
MLHATLKTIHLLAMFAWLGGMFYTLACLRPALSVLEPPSRLKLMSAVLQRFFAAVTWAAALILLSGVAMIVFSLDRSSADRITLHLELSVLVMAVLGFLMIAIYAHIRIVLFGRLQRAMRGGEGPAAASVLNRIRRWVTVNLVIGVVIVVVTQFVPLL